MASTSNEGEKETEIRVSDGSTSATASANTSQLASKDSRNVETPVQNKFKTRISSIKEQLHALSVIENTPMMTDESRKMKEELIAELVTTERDLLKT